MKAISNTRLLFTGMVQKPEDAIDLATTALLIAKEEYSTLDIDHYLAILDSYAREIATRIISLNDPESILLQINQYLFKEQGFRGNGEDYYDPKNSFLNDVIDRKLGIPISLSVLYIEIGKRLGIPIQGIGMPGHFIVKYGHSDHAIFIDPFHHGRLLTEEDCIQTIEDLSQGQMPYHPDFLKPVSNRQILIRMLYNLKAIYFNSKEYTKALEVVERVLLINPDLPQEIRDRAIIRFNLKEYSPALVDFRLYLKLTPFAPDEEEMHDYIRKILGHFAQFN